MLIAILIIVCVLVVLFLLSLIIYFFNLDMKMITMMAPILNKHYDKIKRDPHI